MSPRRRDDAGSEAASHERAVLRQDNGELQEDVVASEELDDSVDGSGGRAASRVDEESEESFPASDAPSHWATGGEKGDGPGSGGGPGGDAGPDGDAGEGRRDLARDRVVERSPVEHVPERARPDDPVPKTLPR